MEKMNLKQEGIAKKIGLAWKKLAPTSNTTDGEKAKTKELIEKLLKQYDLVIDWKTGKCTVKQAGQANTGKQASGQASGQATAGQAKTGKQDTAGKWGTKELLDLIFKMTGKEMTGKNLRRQLRKMDRYNDGVNTHYNWTGPTDPEVIEILKAMGIKKAS